MEIQKKKNARFKAALGRVEGNKERRLNLYEKNKTSAGSVELCNVSEYCFFVTFHSFVDLKGVKGMDESESDSLHTL